MRLARIVREAAVESALVKATRRLGGFAYKFVSPQHRGVPDRLVLWPGGGVEFVELKAPGKQPTMQQLREHERLRKLGFRVTVVDSLTAVNLWAEQPHPTALPLEVYVEATRGCVVSRGA